MTLPKKAKSLKNGAELARDFLSRITITKSDLCLLICKEEGDIADQAAQASTMLSKRMAVQDVRQDMAAPLEVSAKFGFCIGLAEYPEKDIHKVIQNILLAGRRTYFYIARGKRPIWWWLKQFHKVKGSKILYAEQENFGYKIFATAYVQLSDIDDFSQINVASELVKTNVLANLALGLEEITPCLEQKDLEIALVFGGPTINDFAEQIYDHARSGMPIVTANGAYNWCLQHKIIPSAQIVLDCRKFNKRFVEPYIKTCQYLLCSQCDPDLVASLPRESVKLWHPYSASTYNTYVREYKQAHPESVQEWYPIPGGTTVALRTFPLMITLGFRKFHVYGLDSCIIENKHHGFTQPEDDNKSVTVVEYGGRKFQCYQWMVHQCNEFMELTKYLIGQHCDMEIYGEGLIAHCIRTLAAEATSALEGEGEQENGSDQMAILHYGEAAPA